MNLVSANLDRNAEYCSEKPDDFSCSLRNKFRICNTVASVMSLHIPNPSAIAPQFKSSRIKPCFATTSPSVSFSMREACFCGSLDKSWVVLYKNALTISLSRGTHLINFACRAIGLSLFFVPRLNSNWSPFLIGRLATRNLLK